MKEVLKFGIHSIEIKPQHLIVSSNGQYLVIKVSVTYKGDQRKVAGFYFIICALCALLNGGTFFS